ncbi:hypothetical protein POTOM_038148 [Populus tomentosa]|uniref:Uncharacterized protein n=1 Tax=Populus tomentosa TaxID=118781 RepID=A0A8X8CL33_POPTO|nr:hypothetical protein POTOM_038148 [Populus tomentosa]
MSSLKATKPVGTQPTEPVKEEPAAKSSSSAPKVPASKPVSMKQDRKVREHKKKITSLSKTRKVYDMKFADTDLLLKICLAWYLLWAYEMDGLRLWS